jgi:hypothetical protein
VGIEVGEEFTGEYVWATICLRKQKLGVYYRAKDQNTDVLIKQFEYELTEVVKYLRHDGDPGGVLLLRNTGYECHGKGD